MIVIFYISIIIAISIAVILLCVLASTLFNTLTLNKLKKHRSTEEGLADLLNYAAVVDDGIIIGKDGSFSRAWVYQGVDLNSSTTDERESVSNRINRTIKGLGSGWMFHIDAVRKAAPGYLAAQESRFNQTIAEAIDEERRQHFSKLGTLYEGQFVLVATYLPPLAAERKLVDLMFEDETENKSKRQQQDEILNRFKRECSNIESNLGITFTMLPLQSYSVTTADGEVETYDDFLSWLHFCITGLEQPIRLPASPIYLDALIGSKDFYTGVIPKIGNKYIQVVSINGFPLESTPGMLTKLTELSVNYRWSNRFIFLDNYQAISELEKYRRKWKQKVRGFIAQVFNTNSTNFDQDALAMVDDAQDALAETNSGLVAQGYYTGTIILMDENRHKLENAARYIEKEINTLGFNARLEDLNTVEAFFGSLPGHGKENIRRPMINTLNFADFIPTNTVWTGEKFCPCPFYPAESPPLMQVITTGATPFFLNLHVNDVGHTFIFGPTGAGKSTLLAMLIAQFLRYPHIKIRAFDKGHSLEVLTHACNGSHFTIGDSGEHGQQLAFCPLQNIESPADLAWAVEWVENLIILNNVEINPQRLNLIESAIKSCIKSGSVSLSDLSNTMQDEVLRDALKVYTMDGAMGFLLDAKQDSLNISDFICFETSSLLELAPKYCLPVLTYIFRRIEKSLDGSPTVIVLDEAWTMLSHGTFKDKIKKWLKEMRKKNCIVIMASQSLSDATNSGILDVILESCPSKIFLPNNEARAEQIRPIYQKIGLNTRQIDIISSAIPKRQYYYTSPKGRRLFELSLGKLALAFVAVSDPEQINYVNSFRQRYGKNWASEYLADLNIELKQYTN